MDILGGILYALLIRGFVTTVQRRGGLALKLVTWTVVIAIVVVTAFLTYGFIFGLIFPLIEERYSEPGHHTLAAGLAVVTWVNLCVRKSNADVQGRKMGFWRTVISATLWVGFFFLAWMWMDENLVRGWLSSSSEITTLLVAFIPTALLISFVAGIVVNWPENSPQEPEAIEKPEEESQVAPNTPSSNGGVGGSSGTSTWTPVP